MLVLIRSVAALAAAIALCAEAAAQANSIAEIASGTQFSSKTESEARREAIEKYRLLVVYHYKPGSAEAAEYAATSPDLDPEAGP